MPRCDVQASATYIAATTTRLLDEWRAELAALPPRKRKSWKGILADKWNVRQKVRWLGQARTVQMVDGVSTPYEFVVYKHAEKTCGSTWVPVVDLAWRDELPEGTEVLMSDAARRLYDARLKGEDEAVVFDQIQEENMTGNHHRNPKPVRVPTRAGEPVRG